MTSLGNTTLWMWTIYVNPADYPGKYVVRRFGIFPDGPVPDPEPWAIRETLEGARRRIPSYCVCSGRLEEDEPHIVETWF